HHTKRGGVCGVLRNPRGDDTIDCVVRTPDRSRCCAGIPNLGRSARETSASPGSARGVDRDGKPRAGCIGEYTAVQQDPGRLCSEVSRSVVMDSSQMEDAAGGRGVAVLKMGQTPMAILP